MNLTKIYRATLTRRWHANPDMAQVNDEVGAHSGRMAMMLLALWPDSSVEAVKYALVHDLGESFTGDWPAPFKQANPELAQIEAKAGADHIAALGFEINVTRVEMDRVAFCDRLDAYMTVKHHRPHLLERPEWQNEHSYLSCEGGRLGSIAGMIL